MSRDIRGHLWDRVAPCWFGGGTLHCTKSRSAHDTRQRAHKQFTQVRAAARRKTLLLLWWIDGRMDLVVRSTLAQQGFAQGDYVYVVVWGCQLSNLLTPPMSAMGLLL